MRGSEDPLTSSGQAQGRVKWDFEILTLDIEIWALFVYLITILVVLR